MVIGLFQELIGVVFIYGTPSVVYILISRLSGRNYWRSAGGSVGCSPVLRCIHGLPEPAPGTVCSQ